MLVELEVRQGLDDVLREIYVDLEGDGVEGWRYQGPNLVTIRAVRITPRRVGTFRLVVSAVSQAGCQDKTGMTREVVVTR